MNKEIQKGITIKQYIVELLMLVNNQDEYIKLLSDKLSRYEDPDDVTLFALYCNEKVNDRLNKLEKENDILWSIVNEIYKLCNNNISDDIISNIYDEITDMIYKDILDIIDEGTDKIE